MLNVERRLKPAAGILPSNIATFLKGQGASGGASSRERSHRRIPNLAGGRELAASHGRCAQCADGSAESHGRRFSGGRSAKVVSFVTR